MAAKRTCLTMEQKLKIIEEMESGQDLNFHDHELRKKGNYSGKSLDYVYFALKHASALSTLMLSPDDRA